VPKNWNPTPFCPGFNRTAGNMVLNLTGRTDTARRVNYHCSKPEGPTLPTSDELKLLKYLNRSKSASFWVTIVDSEFYEIVNYRSGMKTVQIPCSSLALQVRPFIGTVLFYYPNEGFSETAVRAQARNLRIFLLELEAYLKPIEEQKLREREAEKATRLAARIEYGEVFELEDRPD